MWYETAVTKKLNIRYPIIQAGMAGGVTTPELVAAVSNSGCLGTLGAGYMTVNALRQSIQQIKKITNQPFAVNVFIPEMPSVEDEAIKKANNLLEGYRTQLNISEPFEVKIPECAHFEAQLAVLIEEKVPICSFTFGLPEREIMDRLKRENIVIIGTATTVREALENEAAGVDLVVMQGSEAGGHRGSFSSSFDEAMIGTTALIPQTVDQVQVPVIAAGGIMDGRGILSALLLGAEAVQMGTAFVTTSESGAKSLHKEAILSSSEEELVVTSVYSGKAARGIRNDFINELTPYEKDLPNYPIQNSLTQGIRSEAAKQKRPEWMSLWCGQAPRLSKNQSVEVLIESFLSQINVLLTEKIKHW